MAVLRVQTGIVLGLLAFLLLVGSASLILNAIQTHEIEEIEHRQKKENQEMIASLSVASKPDKTHGIVSNSVGLGAQNPCAGKADLSRRDMLGSVIDDYESLQLRQTGAMVNRRWQPTSDTSMAVSAKKQVFTVNNAVAIYDKNTANRIYVSGAADFWNDANEIGDARVIFAENNKFVYSTWFLQVCNHGLVVQSGPVSLQHGYCTSFPARGSVAGVVIPQQFDITAELVPVTPPKGCSAISQDLTGKIALILRGDCDFYIKFKNAQLKGAVAVVVYSDTRPRGRMAISDPTVVIPGVMIDNSDGLLLAAAAPTTVRLAWPPISFYDSTIGVAISKDDNPAGKTSWNFNRLYQGLIYADFQKVAVRNNVLYLSYKNYTGDEDPLVIRAYSLSQIQTVQHPAPLWTYVWNDPDTRCWWPVEYYYESSPNLPQFFVNFDTANLPQPILLWADASGVQGTIPLDVGWDGYHLFPEVLQPPHPAVKRGLWAVNRVRGTIQNNILHLVAVLLPSTDRTSQSYGVFADIDLSSFPAVSVINSGYIEEDNGIAVFYTSVAANKYGHVGYAMNLASNSQYLTLAHTGRLVDDPVGTVRYPLVLDRVARQSYTAYLDTSDFNRWNDYTDLVRDPSDNITFWTFSSFPINDPLNPSYTRHFTTVAYSFSVMSTCDTGHEFFSGTPEARDPTVLEGWVEPVPGEDLSMPPDEGDADEFESAADEFESADEELLLN